MKITLELMDIVWLQNVKREPGEYCIHNAKEVLTDLVDFGLIDRVHDSGLFITTRGNELLMRSTPIYISDFKWPMVMDYGAARHRPLSRKKKTNVHRQNSK